MRSSRGTRRGESPFRAVVRSHEWMGLSGCLHSEARWSLRNTLFPDLSAEAEVVVLAPPALLQARAVDGYVPLERPSLF